MGDFINHGADVNAKDDFGHTPLHWAAKQGHQEIAELLISKGADVNAKDKDGRSPLHWAIDRDYKDVAELLRKHGAKE